MSVEGWGTYRLAELGELNRGKSKHRPRDAKHLYGGPYPFLQTGDIKAADGLVTSHTQTYSEAGLAQSRLWPRGTVAITIAANIAETAILSFDACFPDSVVGFIANEEKTSGRFVEYLFRRLKRQIQHEHVGSGSVQDNINLGILNQLEFDVPPLPEQAQILRVLGSLDDKIELNRRMNETLEEMARALFRDWFVDFGPTRRQMEGATDPAAIMGHAFPPEKAAIFAPLFPAKLDDDGLPEGWERSTLLGFMEILDSKRVPLSAREREKRVGPYPYHGATSVMGYVDDYLFDDVILLVGEDGSVIRPSGKPFTQYVWGKVWVNNHAHVLKGNQFSTEQLKVIFDNVDIAPFTTGAVQLKLNQKNMKTIPMVRATRELHGAYDSVILPMFAKIRANSEENQTLAEMRDLLLPKLMSGEIRLKDAEAAV